MVRVLMFLICVAGCYEPTVELCSITCEKGGTNCPADMTCGDDLHCHAPGDETTCTFPLTFSLTPSEAQRGTRIQGLIGEEVINSCFEGDCGVEVPGGTSVLVSAVSPVAGPMASEVFTRLSGGCEGDNTCTVVMDGPKVVNATFLDGQRITVAYVDDGVGQVTSTPPGIDCSSTTDSSGCSVVFAADQDVTLHATTESPTAFDGWGFSNCDPTGGDPDCIVPGAAGTADVSATFSVERVSVSILGFNGQQAIDSVDIFEKVDQGGTTVELFRKTCLAPGPCEELFAPRSAPTVLLKATSSNPNRVFKSWFGRCDASQAATCEFDLTADAVVVALFEDPVIVTLEVDEGGALDAFPPPLDIDTLACGPAGAVALTCTGHYAKGTTLTVSHSPSRFTGWQNAACLSAGLNNCVFTVSGDVTVAARYRPPVVTVTFTDETGPILITGSTIPPLSEGNCSANGQPQCAVSAHVGDTIQVKVVDPSRFAKFENCPDPSPNNPAECQFVIDDDIVVKATFIGP